jgi:hypothetical protein
MMPRLRTEDGFAVAASIIVLLIGLLLTTAAIGEALSTETTVRRDGSSKRALQGAKAGIERTVQRLSATSDARSTAAASGAAACLQQETVDPPSFKTLVPSAGQQWCPEITDHVSSDETATTYVSADLDPNKRMIDQRDLVATATATDTDAPRRVKTTWASFDIRQIFRDYTVFSDRTLALQGNLDIGSPDVHGNAGSNGDIDLGSNQNAHIWGDATPGPGQTVTPENRAASQVEGSTAPLTEKIQFPPVTITDDLRNTNDNAALCGGCATSTNPLPNVSLSGSGATIKGNTFVLCSLSLSGTGNPTYTFQATDPDRPIRIFIDAPSNCGYPDYSFYVGQKPTIVLQAPALQLFVVGDASDPSKSQISLNNNYTGGVPITVYAPTSDVTAENHGTLNGGIVGHQVTIQNNTNIVMPTDSPPPLDWNITPVLTRGDFVECTPRVTMPTTDGC